MIGKYTIPMDPMGNGYTDPYTGVTEPQWKTELFDRYVFGSSDIPNLSCV